jgi:hypothetical protein
VVYKRRSVVGVITFIAIIIFGTLWIILYALQANTFRKTASIFGVAALLGGGFFSFGCLLGFMFGIPKMRTAVKPPQAGVPQAGAPQAGAPQAGARQNGTPTTSSFEVNTNLEQVSDWLTKIVVGVTLTQLNSIPTWLKDYAKSLKDNLGGFPNAKAFAAGLLIYYLTVGFMGGYLLTRLYLTKELKEAEESG